MIEWLAENALPIWVVGAVALTMALVVFFHTRSNGALVGVSIVVAVTALLLAAEWLMETPREAVERTLYELAATVERNDVPGTMAFLAPQPGKQLRHDVETLMPLVEIERARVLGAPDIEVTAGGAAVRCRGFILAKNKRNGMKGAAEDRLQLTFVKSGDRWLLQDYTSEKNWNRALGR